MSDETPKKRPLSEIGHLFLSDVRDRQMGDIPRPRRIPPGGRDAGSAPRTDPSPQSEQPGDTGDHAPGQVRAADTTAVGDPESAPVRPITAVIAGHLTGAQLDRARQYARHLAAQQGCGRIGLIELDASELRLMCFDPDTGGEADELADDFQPVMSPDNYDGRRIAEALEEMNWDVTRWLLLIPNPRTLESRTLLRTIDHWVLLTTADHDGVVSAYRMLKGLSETVGSASRTADEFAASALRIAETNEAEHATVRGADPTDRPHLSVAVLDARDDSEIRRVHEKLAGVCSQFLGWPIHPEPPVQDSPAVSEHLALFCRPTRDKAQLATAPHWPIIVNFLARADAPVGSALRTTPSDNGPAATDNGQLTTDTPERPKTIQPIGNPMPATAAALGMKPYLMEEPIAEDRNDPEADARHAARDATARLVGEFVLPATAPAATAYGSQQTVRRADPTVEPIRQQVDTGVSDVLDLPHANPSADEILAAVLHREGSDLAACPLRPPMCPNARLAVSRDGVLTLLAVALGSAMRTVPATSSPTMVRSADPTQLNTFSAIGQAYRWLTENRMLIRMAIPQFTIDPNVPPRLRVLADQADISADALKPLLQTGHVTIHPYRTLRWGGKTGLLLEAA